MRIFYATMDFINPDTLDLNNGGIPHYLYKTARTLVKQGHDISVVMGSDRNGYIKHKGINVFFVKVWDSPFFLIKRLFMSKENAEFYKKFGNQNAIKNFILKQHLKKPIDIVQYPNIKGMAKFANSKIPFCVRVSSYVKLLQENEEYFDKLEEKTEIEIDKSAKFLFGASENTAKVMVDDGVIAKSFTIIETPCIPFNSDREIPSLAYKIKDIIGESKFLLFYGSMTKKNGLIEIADCIYDILNSHPDIYFIFIGKVTNKEQDFISLLKEKAREFNNRVLWYDKQSLKYLYPVLKRAYGVLLPARYKNFSNSCIESMMLRKLVIATDTYFGQLIEDGKTGLLCKTRDSASLKTKIEELLALSPEKKYEIEKNAFENTSHLSAEVITEKLLKYYQHVIDNWE